MPEAVAQYSCDSCRSRKVGCSRERSGCQRCQTEGIRCQYSRSGVIRRNRKHNQRGTDASVAAPPSTSDPPTISDPGPSGPPSGNRDGTACEHLQRHMPSRSQHSIRAIGALLEEYASAWQGSEAFEKLSEPVTYSIPFREEQIQSWLHEFAAALEREKLLLVSVPPEVLNQLASSCPHQVKDRAWLVMFYSIALSVEFSSDTSDDATKAQLRSNLWLAFNDVRLLIEPAITSIQALIIMVFYAEEFMTPSVSWSLVAKACVMLQALGITHWSLDAATSERRIALFWRLNQLDKELALILCRPPIFHREMGNSISLLSLDRGAPRQQRRRPDGGCVLFEAHYNNQMHLLSRVRADIWQGLYGPDGEKVTAIEKSLESWYHEAKQVLEAAALVEKPFLASNDVAMVDFGLQTLHFHYLSLLVLLTVSSKRLRSRAIRPAEELLNLLPKFGGRIMAQREPFNCLLWQYLHCPLAAFGALWGEIVIKPDADTELSKQLVQAIEHLPRFLSLLSSRNSLAGKLQSITTRMVEHARATLGSHSEAHAATQDLDTSQPNPLTPGMRSTPPHAAWKTASGGNFDAPLDEKFGFVNDPFWDTTFDWFAWSTEDPSIEDSTAWNG